MQPPALATVLRYGLPDARWHHEQSSSEGEATMSSGKVDEFKGRVKEAAGALAGNEKLKQEGKADQVVGKVKQTAENFIDKLKTVVK